MFKNFKKYCEENINVIAAGIAAMNGSDIYPYITRQMMALLSIMELRTKFVRGSFFVVCLSDFFVGFFRAQV